MAHGRMALPASGPALNGAKKAAWPEFVKTWGVLECGPESTREGGRALVNICVI